MNINIDPSTMARMDFQTIWKAGRKDKVIAAHDTFYTYAPYDIQRGESPIEMSKRSSGIRLCISSAGSQVSGNIEHGAFADIAMQWRALMPKLLTGTDNAVDVTREKAKFIPGHQMKGKSAAEIADMVGADELADIVAKLNASTSYQENNRHFASLLLLAQNAKRAEKVAMKDGRTIADVLLENADDQYVLDAKYPMLRYLRDAANNDGRLLAVLSARKNGTEPDNSTYVLYDRTKTPGGTPRADGKVRVYTLSIRVTPGSDMPVNVFIENGYGVPSPNGGVGILGGTKVDAVSKSFSLTREEFSGFIDAAETLILMKRMKYALWDGALALNEELRKRQKAQRDGQQTVQPVA